MLAELDDLTPSKPCLEYADRMKAAGNPNVVTKVYGGQYHAWELIGPVVHMKNTENYSAATGRSLLQRAAAARDWLADLTTFPSHLRAVHLRVGNVLDMRDLAQVFAHMHGQELLVLTGRPDPELQ